MFASSVTLCSSLLADSALWLCESLYNHEDRHPLEVLVPIEGVL